MDKKAQILVFSLWVLVILTILTVHTAHRVAIALRLNYYQKNKLAAAYMAHAGLNRAIAEIESDSADFDSLIDGWADNKIAFEHIVIGDERRQAASVYFIQEEEGKAASVFGVIDEQRKININTAPENVLISLLEGCGVASAPDCATAIRIWRGELTDENKIFEREGYMPKQEPFLAPEELLLVVGIGQNDYDTLRQHITVYGDGLININTVSLPTLTMLTRAICKDLSISESFAQSVTAKIMELRKNRGYFTNRNDIAIETTGDEETNVLNGLLDKVTFQSSEFLIAVTANASTISSSVNAIYNRPDKKIVHWHEH
jgi:type II secretory pathway component PulK